MPKTQQPSSPDSKAICPVCKKEVLLSVFDLFLPHGKCINAGYTIQEAEQLPRPRGGQ